MFWFLLPGDRASFLHNLACVDVCFLCRRSPPTHRGSCFMFPDASLNPEIWEEVSSECCCCSKEHPSAALPGKISLFSYANELLFRVGAAEGGAQLLRCGLESVLGFSEMEAGWKALCFGPMNQDSFEGGI